MNTPNQETNKWAKEKAAFAEGKRIQFLSKFEEGWKDCPCPSFRWTDYQYRIHPDDDAPTCRHFGTPTKPGQAIPPAMTDHGDGMHTGIAHLIDCQKCPQCGHSFTVGKGEAIRAYILVMDRPLRDGDEFFARTSGKWTPVAEMERDMPEWVPVRREIQLPSLREVEELRVQLLEEQKACNNACDLVRAVSRERDSLQARVKELEASHQDVDERLGNCIIALQASDKHCCKAWDDLRDANERIRTLEAAHTWTPMSKAPAEIEELLLWTNARDGSKPFGIGRFIELSQQRFATHYIPISSLHPPIPAPTEDAERVSRDEFEAFCQTKGWPVSRWTHSQRYWDEKTEAAWLAWSAARKGAPTV